MPEHEQVLAYRRVSADEAALVACPFSAEPAAAPLTVPPASRLLLGHLPAAARPGQAILHLRPYEAAVYRLG